MNIGSKLRKVRKEKGITLPQLAQKTGLSLSFLSYFENDLRNGSKETIKAIASALKLTCKQLQDLKIDSKLEEIGMTNPEFVMMFKEVAVGKMNSNEKRKILKAYEIIKNQRKKYEYKEGGERSN